MPAALPFIGPIIGGLGGLLGGIGASRSRTSQQGSSFSNTQTQRGILGKRQKELNRQLFQILSAALAQGPTVSQAARNTARTQINNTVDSIRPRLESQFVSRGFGDSGKFTGALKDLEIDRLKAFQGSEAQLRGEAEDRFMQMLGLSQQFTRPRSFTSTSSGTSTGTSTQPGQSLLSSLGGLGGNIGTLLFLQSLLGGGGGSELPIAGPTSGNLGDYFPR